MDTEIKFYVCSFCGQDKKNIADKCILQVPADSEFPTYCPYTGDKIENNWYDDTGYEVQNGQN